MGAQLLLRGLPASERPPLVSEIHHLPGCPRAAGPDERLGLALHHLYVRAVWRRLAGLRVVNRTVAAQIGRWGVPPERIHVLSSFYLDHATFRPRPSPKEWDVVFCGRLVPNKAPSLLIDAVAHVARSIQDVRCAIVGEGPRRPQMERQIARRGLARNVAFLGWLPAAEDVAQVYNRSRLLVCTSYNEGGPRVTLEAMACGLPVVSTPVGIMPEVIDDGRSGLLADWRADGIGEKIMALLADEAAARRIGEAGREAVRRFNYDDEIGRYGAAYLRLARSER